MSRHMAFWKYEDGVYLDNNKVYNDVCIDMQKAEGLSVLPISDILAKVNEVFADYEKLDECNFEGPQSAFTVFTTEQSVLFDCGWSLPAEELNKIIDIMLDFGCPFYDPQIETRFDGHGVPS